MSDITLEVEQGQKVKESVTRLIHDPYQCVGWHVTAKWCERDIPWEG